jgi:DNA-binding LacI/PurR family transcriptional regulator
MTARLADIARRADVSEATVSRVLNDRPGVAEATRNKVLRVVDVLGYDRPSRLRRKSTGLVGLITPDMTNPIFPGIAQVLEPALTAEGFTPVLCTDATLGANEDTYVEMMLERGVAGIVFVCGTHTNIDSDPARYNRLREHGLPIVLFNGYLDGVDAPFVSNDDVYSAQLATSHLVDLGHQRIGLAAGPPRYISVVRKIAGYRAATAELLGMHEVDSLIAHASFSVAGGAAAAVDLIQSGVTGIVCASDEMALGAIREARKLGVDVPRDLSVVGFDDSPLMAFTDPALTTVRQNIKDMGHTAVRLLLDQIQGKEPSLTELLFRPTLVVRASTSVAPEQVTSVAVDTTAGHKR